MRIFKKSSDKLNRLAVIAVSAVTAAAVFGAFNAANKTKAFSDSDFSADLDGILVIGAEETDEDGLLPSIETLPGEYIPEETTEEEVDDPFNPDNDESAAEETTLPEGIFTFDVETDPADITTAPADTDDTAVPPPTLYLTYYTFNLTVGQEAQIYWYVENSIFGGYHEYFSIDDSAVAEVSESGVIKAKAAGTANITVKWGDLTATATVTVSEAQTATRPPDTRPGTSTAVDPVTENTSDKEQDTSPSQSEPAPVPKVKLDGCLYNTSGNAVGDVMLSIGEMTAVTDLNGYFSFPRSDIGEIKIFAALNEQLSCTMNLSDNATVFLLYSGEALECFTSYEEMAARFVITEISLEKPSKRIYIGDVLIPYFQYEPRDAALTDTKYVSSDENVAAVDQNGVITAKAAGETVITLILNNGQAQTAFTLTVNPQEIGKYSGIIAAVEILIILIVLGSGYAVYKRYKRRINEESAFDSAPKTNFKYAHIPSETETALKSDQSNEEEEKEESAAEDDEKIKS